MESRNLYHFKKAGGADVAKISCAADNQSKDIGIANTKIRQIKKQNKKKY